MSVFKRILEEKRKSNVGPTESGIENARKKLVKQFNRPSRQTTSPSGDLYTNMAGGNIPDEQKYDQLERIGKQKQSKSVSAASDVDVKSRVQASNTAARAKETKPPQRRRLDNTTKGGPVKTFKLPKPAPAPTQAQVVKQSDVSKKASEFRANKRGALSKQVDPILKDLKIQGQRQRELQRRMSAGYDRTITRRGEDLLKQIRADAPATGREAMMTAQRNRAAKSAAKSAAQPYRNLGLGSEKAGRSLDAKRVRASNPVRATRPQQYSNLGLGQERAGQRVVNRPVNIRVAQPKQPTQLPKPQVKPKLTAAQQKKVTQRILKSAKSKSQLGPRLQTKTVSNLAGKVTTQASKVKPKVTAGGVLGRGFGALGAAYDVAQGREDAKKAGAGDTRSWLRGAARAAGGLIGGGLGAAAGGPLAIATGTAGYMAGSNLADKAFTSLAGATKGQKDWMKKANLASQKGTAVDNVKYRKGNKAVIYDPRVGKERIGTFDPTSGKFKAANLATSKAYTARNPFERLGRQFSRSNEGSGLFGLNIVKGGALANMAKKYYADKDEKARAQRVSDFKKAASAK